MSIIAFLEEHKQTVLLYSLIRFLGGKGNFSRKNKKVENL